MIRPMLTFTTETLTIRPWANAAIDQLGFDPRSSYVEQFWLGILGPSTTWFLRRVAAHFDAAPDGFELSLTDTARALGLGDRNGRNSPFLRSVNRTIQFELAQVVGDDHLLVRRRLPPLTRRQVVRLPDGQQDAHARWQEQQGRAPSAEQQRRRSRQLALSLLELGEDQGAAERQLLRWRYPPTLAREAAVWAWERHQSALAAATAG